VNALCLSAQLSERGLIRYTPAGLPALDLVLHHESTVWQDEVPRQVTVDLKALAIGSMVAAVKDLSLGQSGRFEGFLASARNGKGVLFHLTSVQL